MGFELTINYKGSGHKEYIPVCGKTTAVDMWKPIITSNHLTLLKTAFESGLNINKDNKNRFVDEINTVIMRIKESYPDAEHAIERCKRVLKEIDDFPPEAGYEFYLGQE